MAKTNFNKFPNAIIRERNYGKSNLIYYVDNKKALTDPNIPRKDYVDTVANMSKLNRNIKPDKKITRFGAENVANNEFKAMHPVTYQGYKTGIVNNRLPLSFIPAEIKSYNINAGGVSYNEGAGEVAEQENRGEPPPPKLHTQWEAPKRTIATQWRPNPFPIEINKNVKIR